jgi:hypothetical protein
MLLRTANFNALRSKVSTVVLSQSIQASFLIIVVFLQYISRYLLLSQVCQDLPAVANIITYACVSKTLGAPFTNDVARQGIEVFSECLYAALEHLDYDSAHVDEQNMGPAGEEADQHTSSSLDKAGN